MVRWWPALMLLSVALAGCSSGGCDDPLCRFEGAEQRHAASHDEAGQHRHDVSFTGEPAVLRLSIEAPDGFRVDVLDGVGEDRNGFRMGRTASIREMHYALDPATAAGPGAVVLDCHGPCRYALAVDRGAVPTQVPVESHFRDADARAVERLQGETHTVALPVSAGGDVRVRVSLTGEGFVQYRLSDSDGDPHGWYRFDEAALFDFGYIARDVPAGDWRLELECGGTCTYVVGLYV